MVGRSLEGRSGEGRRRRGGTCQLEALAGKCAQRCSIQAKGVLAVLIRSMRTERMPGIPAQACTHIPLRCLRANSLPQALIGIFDKSKERKGARGPMATTAARWPPPACRRLGHAGADACAQCIAVMSRCTYFHGVRAGFN